MQSGQRRRDTKADDTTRFQLSLTMMKPIWNEPTASLHGPQACLKSARRFISAGELPGQLSPVTGQLHKLRDERWLRREGGGSCVTEIWDNIPEVPGRILGTRGLNMCVCV